ncbi:MAG: hypothetical protein NTZ46_10770 [Verrucomicrobia bacterium]|nr:hypothetical protein [Verrucomicrobiota bacterium]
MGPTHSNKLADVIGNFPYRIALAGGWIDQPFCSSINPTPPGSMVVVGVEPNFIWMERAGIGTGTRNVALKLWGGLPEGDPAKLVDELYAKENEGAAEPSGSQDMIGLIYPGINRLDYDSRHRCGIFPCHIESNTDPEIAKWLEQVINVLPIAPRPPGYSPLGIKNLDPEWARRLGQSGKACFDAIVSKDIVALGASMNECMLCWKTMLPHVLAHPTIPTDLAGLLAHYQSRYPGAMYSGCGGGYLFVASEEPVPGAFRIKVRLA